MFQEQSMRLRRRRWDDPQMLADELFAMFQAQVPLTHQGPLILERPEGSDFVPLTFRGFSSGETIFNITPASGTPISIQVGETGTVGTESATPASASTVTTSASVFAGSVLARAGTLLGRAAYSVSVYEQGLSRAATTRTVIQLQQATGSTDLAAGTAVLVVRGADGVYFMQAPVWG